MARFSPTIDHVCMNPKGRVSRNKVTSRMTVEQKASARRAATRSFVATTRHRAALTKVEIVQHDSSWCHVRDGEVVARFSTINEAVDALHA